MILAQLPRRASAAELVFLPGLTGVRCDPGLLSRTGQLAVQAVSELNPDNVIGENFSIDRGSYLHPMLPGIGRVQERARRTAHPDVLTIRRQGSKNCLAADRNRLPASAGIQ